MADTDDLDSLLRGDSFEDQTFTGLELQDVELGGKEFVGCKFVGCKGQESRWRGVRLEDCVFERCDLTQAKVAGMVAGKLQFRHSKLMGIEWTELGKFASLAFVECTLQYASFLRLSLRKAEFIDCTLTEANFFEVDLGEATFRGSTLNGSVFRGCKLRKTDFSAATGAFFDPAQNEAREAVIAIETAALLAMHLGLRVSGYSSESGATAKASRGRRK
ncbi:pentapeptide repeat-containing protein [Nannocystis radixulma]|uniref:Pentapeptide repeat-containing protein n=1 Tax=Nannocystis radixulma TaxID=2995305 RepID=A0ABT5BI21_9BACT|nr:pentapeptide repeat-containing protein [Nannocystis radixulma]MDC0673752.1 pentapeptide repeat-containing protein [Nannocystis radixulma]